MSVKKSTKGKGKVSYDVITQVVVNLSPVTCSVKDVSQLVAKQVNFFYVTLMDSKGYPLLAPVVNLSGNQPASFDLQIPSHLCRTCNAHLNVLCARGL